MADQEESIQEQLYELGEVVRSGEHFKVYEARERTLGADCLFHEYEGPEELSSHGRDRALTMLKRYATLYYPRTPRIADAWLRPHGLVAIEFSTPAVPIGLEDNNPLSESSPMTRGGLFEDTLALLAALHRAEVTHGNLRPECFGVGPLGRLYFMDIGMDNILPNYVVEAGGDDFALSQNIFGRDTASWAYWMLSLCIGEQVYREAEGAWDEVDLREAEKFVPSVIKQKPVAEFMKNCLLGFSTRGGPYDSAWDALQDWRKKQLRKVIE